MPGNRLFENVPAEPSAVVELRQYTLRPGQRDELIELFENRLVAGQEAAGMRLHGEFRDANDPDRFIWLRGFPDMPARSQLLEAFYDGPVWKAARRGTQTVRGTYPSVLTPLTLQQRSRTATGISKR